MTRKERQEMQVLASNVETKRDAIELAKVLNNVLPELTEKLEQLNNFLGISVLPDDLREFDTKRNAQLRDRLGAVQSITDLVSICTQKAKGKMSAMEYNAPKYDYEADDEKEGERIFESCEHCGCSIGHSEYKDVCQSCGDDGYSKYEGVQPCGDRHADEDECPECGSDMEYSNYVGVCDDCGNHYKAKNE